MFAFPYSFPLKRNLSRRVGGTRRAVPRRCEEKEEKSFSFFFAALDWRSQPSNRDQMGRALSNATLVAAISDGIALLASRRGYCSAAAAVAGRRSRAVVEEKAAAAMKRDGGLEPAAAPSSSWVPDPVTGYYQPANRAAEIDPAELRAMLLKPKPQH